MSEHYETPHGSSDHRDHHDHQEAEHKPRAPQDVKHAQEHAAAAESHNNDHPQVAAGYPPSAESAVQQPELGPQYGPQPLYAGAAPPPMGVAPAAHYPGSAPAYPHPVGYAAAPQSQPQPVMMPGIPPGPAYYPGHVPGEYGSYFAHPAAPAYPPSAYPPYPGPASHAHAGHPHSGYHPPAHAHGSHHHAGYAGPPGAPAGMSELMEEISNGGNGLSSLSRMLNLDDQEFWKGAVIGAAAVLLLTNETVQKTLLRTSVKAKDTIQDSVDKIKQTARAQKEKFQDKTQDSGAGDAQ